MSLAPGTLLGPYKIVSQLVGCVGRAAACDAVGEIQFICDVIGPEDLAIVPGSQWVIASGNQEGGRIQLVNVRDKTATTLFPAPGRRERLDAATYPTCPRIERLGTRGEQLTRTLVELYLPQLL